MTLDIDNFDESILISSLELINFMCHDHLIIKFNKPFTCIGGRNGSGKSAIMISLGILFGQRLTSLERGNSLKNMIKTGEQFLSIKCVLNNTKRFMYNFFGDFIIIEKRVTCKSNSFSISNKYKKNYSTKVEDLEYLLDFFNLKFDNPLNYLTQEQAKKFLSTTDPCKLYNLFMKGTEILDIKEINQKYKNNINELKNKIKNVHDVFLNVEKELNSESKRMEIIENIDKLKNEIINCENEIKWTKVYESKNEADNLNSEIQKINLEIQNLQNENTKLLEESENLKQERANLINKSSLLKQENKERILQIDEKIARLEKMYRSIQNDLQELKSLYDIKKDLIRRYEKSNNFIDKRPQLYKKKEDYESNLVNVKEKEIKLYKQLEIKKLDCENQLIKKKEYEGRVYALEKQIRFYQSTNIEMHPYMTQVLNQIKRTKFDDQIIGPIGNYVKLKDQKWWKAASIILRNHLTSFICFNQKDRERLMTIFKNNRASFTVLIPSSKSNQVIRFDKNLKFTTLLDVLEIQNPIVLNQLIIMSSIEQIALMDNRSLAFQAIRKDPRNIESIYLISGDRIKKQEDSVSDFAPRKQDKYFFENPTTKKKEYEMELQKLKQNPPNLDFIEDFNELSQEYDKLQTSINTLERKCSEIEREIEHAEDAFSAQKELVNNEEIFDSYKSLESQISHLSSKLNSIKNEMDLLSQEKIKISNTTYPTASEIDRVLHKLQIQFNITNDNIGKVIQKKVQKVERHKELLKEFENNRSNLLINTKEYTNPRSYEILNDIICRFKLEIEESKKVGNKEDTVEKINQLILRKQENEEILKFNKDKINELHEYYEKRVKRREELKNEIACKASKDFEELTNLRGYKGKLVFDHENEQIHLNMIVHDHAQAGSKETLSGGERSFAAMSLLFSLWPHIECPIKVLDEFDVFMDDLNRKFIIKRFIEYFKKKKDQIILITPLNTKDLEDIDVDIQILYPPDRSK